MPTSRPHNEAIHRSRYERRVQGFTLEKIAEQDNVTDGAVWQSITGYSRRAGLPPPHPETVTASKLAEALGVSADKVARWKAKGILPSEPHGKSAPRFNVAHVREALERLASATPVPDTERTCCECSRTLTLNAFITITVRDKRCRPGHSWTGPSYDCADCRSASKRNTRAQRKGFPSWEEWQNAKESDPALRRWEITAESKPSQTKLVTIPRLTADEVKRFARRYTATEGCWEWDGTRSTSGYGSFSIFRDGRRIKLVASRVAWCIANDDDVPSGLFVLHRCDNPPCVNPSHLFVGTNVDNMLDMVSKDRQPPLSRMALRRR